MGTAENFFLAIFCSAILSALLTVSHCNRSSAKQKADFILECQKVSALPGCVTAAAELPKI